MQYCTLSKVGYGDVYPSTMCGRIIAIFAGTNGKINSYAFFVKMQIILLLCLKHRWALYASR